jgi:phosphonopyruvate decarboxylase
MINCADFYELLIQQGIQFFAGVPDSLLQNLCAYISDHASQDKHIISANEGAAIALAAGYHLATGSIGLVFMQNSGLGNALNPLTSLVDPEVYSIPVLMVIGWRGCPGVKDEPQHVKQGKVTIPLLETLGIPYKVLPDHLSEAQACLEEAMKVMLQRQSPYAFVVRKDTFSRYLGNTSPTEEYNLAREEAITAILESVDEQALVVSTTGMISREVFEYRARGQQGHHRDFLTVGCMGHASQIALGIALARPDRPVYCLDGDGSWIMHMGSAAVTGSQKAGNFKHIVLNNGAHDSVGGQPTAGFIIDIPRIALACGYESAARVNTLADLKAALAQWRPSGCPSLLEVRVRKGARPDLGRPTTSPLGNKNDFMQDIIREKASVVRNIS